MTTPDELRELDLAAIETKLNKIKEAYEPLVYHEELHGRLIEVVMWFRPKRS